MIKIHSKMPKEIIYSFNLFGDKKFVWCIIENESPIDLEIEFRKARYDLLQINVERFLALEREYKGEKDLRQQEAYNVIKDWPKWMMENKYNMVNFCECILKCDKHIKILARPGFQYFCYHSLINTAQEQLNYEQEYNDTLIKEVSLNK